VANHLDHETSPTSLTRHHHLGGICLPDRRFGSLPMFTSISPCFSTGHFLSWVSSPVFYIQNSRPQVAPTGPHCLEETVETAPELARPNSVASGEIFPFFCIWGLKGTISSVTGRNNGTIGHLLLCHRAEDGLATCIWSLLLRNRYTTGLIHVAGYPINRCCFCLSRRRELRYFFLSRVLRVICHDVRGDQTVWEEPSLT
jgi:hypothetical protein